jgi:hypothetical protein
MPLSYVLALVILSNVVILAMAKHKLQNKTTRGCAGGFECEGAVIA